MRVKKSSDCGNSPKNKLAQDIVIALFRGDHSFLNKVTDEKFEWQTSASKIFTEIGTTPQDVKSVTSIEIEFSITHGKTGAVNGVLKTESTEKRFCVALEFTTASAKKVKKATNYWLK
jgi:hypothetical protein